MLHLDFLYSLSMAGQSGSIQYNPVENTFASSGKYRSDHGENEVPARILIIVQERTLYLALG